MSGQVDPQQADFEKVSSELDQGLKSCRSVLRSYQAILGESHEADNSNEPPAKPASTGD